MKDWGRKLLGIVLCTAMVIGLAPGAMSDATLPLERLYVAGVDIVNQTGHTVTGESGTAVLSFSSGNPVLTLTDFKSTG